MFDSLLFILLLVFVVMAGRLGGRIKRLEQTLARVTNDIADLKLNRPVEPSQPATQRAASTPSPSNAPANARKSIPAAASSVVIRQQPSVPVAGKGKVQPPPPVPPSAAAGLAPSTSPSLEERLGTRWPVWLGGITLGLGGLMLVRFSIEQGYFGPTARIFMALMLAAALTAAGEWFRRGEVKLGLGAIPSAHVPGVLTAAGSVTAFGAVYAAHGLYELIGTAPTFLLLGAVGLATVLAAALHGPLLGALGLVGSYAAPLLVASQRPNPWPLVLYLAIVATATMILARLRRWLWLAVLAVVGAGLWGLVFVLRHNMDDEWRLAGYLHALLQLGLGTYFLAVGPHRSSQDRSAPPDWIGTAVLCGLTLLVATVLFASRFELATTVPFVLLAAAVLAGASWVCAPAAGAAVLAGIVLVALVVRWPGVRHVDAGRLPLPDEFARLVQLPEAINNFLIFAAVPSLTLTAMVAMRLRYKMPTQVSTAGLLAIAGTVPVLCALVLAYLRVTQFDHSISFATAAALLSIVFTVIAKVFERHEEGAVATRLTMGAFAVAALAALSMALTMALDRGYLTVAFAVTALGAAAMATRGNVPLLQHTVTTLALIVLGRIAWDPRIMGANVGTWPILNWLLVGYGVPAAAFWASGRQLEAHGAINPARLAYAVAVVLAGLLAAFQIRHALNGGDVLTATSSHIEMGLMAFVALLLSYALLKLDLGRANLVFRFASVAYGTISMVLSAFGLGLIENPLFTRGAILGPAVFSSLLLAYALPAAMAAVVARASRGVRPTWYVRSLAVLAMALLFGYATLEVRHVFQGANISVNRFTTQPEQWTYSIVWLLLGVAMLAYGILRASFEARLASAALVLLSVLKVFFFDLSRLSGIWRPLSFIMLGLVLIGIGLAYQTLLFGKHALKKNNAKGSETPT